MSQSSEQKGVPAKHSHLALEQNLADRANRDYAGRGRLYIDIDATLAELNLAPDQEAILITVLRERVKAWVKQVYKMELHNRNRS